MVKSVNYGIIEILLLLRPGIANFILKYLKIAISQTLIFANISSFTVYTSR